MPLKVAAWSSSSGVSPLNLDCRTSCSSSLRRSIRNASRQGKSGAWKSGRNERPSTKSGVSAAAIWAMVGARSMLPTTASICDPAGTPGPRMTHRHPDVLVVGGVLAGDQPVRAHVKAVVRAVDDVGVVELAHLAQG